MRGEDRGRLGLLEKGLTSRRSDASDARSGGEDTPRLTFRQTLWLDCLCMKMRLLFLWLAVVVAGCGSSQRTVTPMSRPLPDERPDDLAVAATVFGPKAALPDAELPRSLKPGRYIIESDGVLRASQGGDSLFPPRVRQLTPRQSDQIWRLLRDSGLLDETNPNRINDPESLVRSGDRTTALLYVAYAGTRTTLKVALDRSNADAVAAERIVDHLADLAWVKD